VKPLLERFDQDSDGKLTPDELSQSDRRMGFDDPAALDKDKNGEISLIELDTAVTARREQMREKWRGRQGAAIGADGN
jgi:Ca2+-binding EF-hand superfamily protein